MISPYSYGGHSERETPGSIPNPEAKPFSADGTAWETAWESRCRRTSSYVGGRRNATPNVILGPLATSGHSGTAPGSGKAFQCQTTHQGLARTAAAPRIDRPPDRHLVDPDRHVPTPDVRATPGRATASRRAATATGAHRVAMGTEGHPAVTMALRIGADHPARTAPRAPMSRQRAAVGRSTVLTSIPMP